MTQITLRDQNHITLPAAIVAEAKLRVGDVLEVQVFNGAIVLQPLAKVIARLDVADFLGVGNGMWGGSAEEIDATMRAERDTWVRQ